MLVRDVKRAFDIDSNPGDAPSAIVSKLIHRKVVFRIPAMMPALPSGSRASPMSEQAGGEEVMTAAGQALLLTGELFVLSFVGIFGFWFADKLRRSLTGKP